MEKSDRIPESMHSKFASITSKTDPFFQRYLNDEYRQLVRQRLQHCAAKDHPHCYEEAKISGQRDLFMLSALQILFLTSRKHLIATLPIFTRSLALLLALDRVSPSKFDINPLIWMLTVNGMMVDVRHLPIEVQEVAYQKGLIPYVPGAKHS